MSTRPNVDNPSSMISRAHEEGRAFQHQQELFRDSWLNGATAFCLDIERQALTRTTNRAARRMGWDNGYGMPLSVLTGAFANFNASSTVEVSPYIDVDADPSYHGRHGVGGRASTLAFNHYGLVTCTVHNGAAYMLWWYKTKSGEFVVRDLPVFTYEVTTDAAGNDVEEFIETGQSSIAVPPYREPEWLYYDTDPEFSDVLLALGMEEGEDTDGERLVRNPEAGLDWRDVLLQHALLVSSPSLKDKAIADEVTTEEDGDTYSVTAKKDGLPAHGTYKVMMGDTPHHDTAITGDPFFQDEAQVDLYSTWLQNHMWEAPIEIRVWTLFPRTTGKHTTWDVEITDPTTGRSETVTLAAQQREVKGIKRHLFVGDENGTSVSLLEFESKPIYVDDYGTELTVYVVAPDTAKYPITKREGFIGVYYNNEIYGRSTSVSDYRRLGIADSALQKRLVFLFRPPLADKRPESFQQGVKNNTARSDLLWLPGGGPIHHRYADWASEYLQQEPAEIVALKTPPEATNLDDEGFRKEFAHLFKDVTKSLVEAAAKRIKGRGRKRAVDSKTLGYLEGRGTTPISDTGMQAKAGEEEKQKRSGKGGKGGGGGTKGDHIKGLPDTSGTVLGGPAKVLVKTTVKVPTAKSKPQTNDLEPPILQFTVTDQADQKWEMFSWMVRDGDTLCKKNAGVLVVNMDQIAVEAWVAAYDGSTVVARPEKMGNEYLLSEIFRYVSENPEYDPVEVARAVYGVYCDCARQQIIVAIAQRTTLTWSIIQKNFLTPEALTMGANHRGDMRYRIQGRLGRLAKRAVA